MTHKSAASFGAWHAVRSTLPDTKMFRSAETSGKDGISAMLGLLGIKEDRGDITGIEQSLLVRYAHAIGLVERFLLCEDAKLLLWLREEFDWYNFLLLAKNIRAHDDNARIKRFLFTPPIALHQPPDPAAMTSDEVLLAAYDCLFGRKELAAIREALKKPFYETESAAEKIRIGQLEQITSTLDSDARRQLQSYIAMRRGKSASRKLVRRMRLFDSTVSRFLELAEARDSIRRLCKAAARGIA